MAVDEVRLRVTNADESGTADVEISETGFQMAQSTLTEGTEITIIADGAEFDIQYVGDKSLEGDA